MVWRKAARAKEVDLSQHTTQHEGKRWVSESPLPALNRRPHGAAENAVAHQATRDARMPVQSASESTRRFSELVVGLLETIGFGFVFLRLLEQLVAPLLRLAEFG